MLPSVFKRLLRGIAAVPRQSIKHDSTSWSFIQYAVIKLDRTNVAAHNRLRFKIQKNSSQNS